LWRTTTRTSGPRGLNLLNRRMRTRMSGGVAGESGQPLPLCRFQKEELKYWLRRFAATTHPISKRFAEAFIE
jgi:hypothetical protein